MKSWYYLLLGALALIALGYANEEIDIEPAPLLTFKEGFPIDADATNKRMQEQQLNPASNTRIFQDREIPWIGMLSLAAAFVLLVTAKKPTPPVKLTRTLNSKQQALMDLESIHGLLKDKSYDDYYTALTHLLRHYIETTYHVPADARTTEEFLHEMALHPIFPSETQAALKAFLQNADRVKYGNLPTTHDDAEEAFQLAIKLITS